MNVVKNTKKLIVLINQQSKIKRMAPFSIRKNCSPENEIHSVPSSSGILFQFSNLYIISGKVEASHFSHFVPSDLESLGQ